MKIETRFNVGDKVCLLGSARHGEVIVREILRIVTDAEGTRYDVEANGLKPDIALAPAPRFEVGQLVSNVYGSSRVVEAMKWVDGTWAYTLGVDGEPYLWTEAELVAVDQPKPAPAPAVEFKFKVGQIAYMPPHNECTVAASFIVNGLPAYLVASEATKVKWMYEQNLKPA